MAKLQEVHIKDRYICKSTIENRRLQQSPTCQTKQTRRQHLDHLDHQKWCCPLQKWCYLLQKWCCLLQNPVGRTEMRRLLSILCQIPIPFPTPNQCLSRFHLYRTPQCLSLPQCQIPIPHRCLCQSLRQCPIPRYQFLQNRFLRCQSLLCPSHQCPSRLCPSPLCPSPLCQSLLCQYRSHRFQ